MQKRILNYRPTWDIQGNYDRDEQNENITANYYPIQQAISMKTVDEKRIFTVTNDRSQAGSSLEEGSIELMQHRRIPADDTFGMGEVLNELDQYNNSIRVPATYFVNIDEYSSENQSYNSPKVNQ
jgi:lysosomal alpha-mannosidase